MLKQFIYLFVLLVSTEQSLVLGSCLRYNYSLFLYMEVFTYLILGVREILPVQLSLKYSILECTRHQCICMKFVHKSIMLSVFIHRFFSFMKFPTTVLVIC